jgi:hypothetical protein
MTIHIVRLGFLLAATIPAPPAAAQAGLAPIEAYAEVLERPLFSTARRRHAPPPVTTSSAVLSGIVIHGSERYAVFANESPSVVRVREGERTAAGVVLRILPDRVVLARPEGGETELRLVPGAVPGMPNALPPAPAVPHIRPTGTAVTIATPVLSETSVARTARPAPADNTSAAQR